MNPAVELERQIAEPESAAEFVSDDPDFEIVARVKNGETDAFEELVRKHGRRVYRSLISILGSAEEAEDALQDAFLKAFQHLPAFEARSRFSTWLVRIAPGCKGCEVEKSLTALMKTLKNSGPETSRPGPIVPKIIIRAKS